MRCNQAKDLISLALDEPITEYDRSRLGDHLAACPDCLRHQDVLLQGREALQQGLVEPPDNFEWKVQLGIQRQLREGARQLEPSGLKRRFWLPAGVTTVAVATLVLVSGWILMPGPSADTGPDLAGGERPSFLPEVGFPAAGMGHQVGARQGILPRESTMPLVVRQVREPDVERLQQEREILIQEVHRLRIENARLRALQPRPTLSEPSRQEP